MTSSERARRTATASAPGTLAEDLAARPDDALVALLAARPDLASPPPAGTAVLAQRALAAPSINLVADDLDLLGVAVLEQVIRLCSAAAGRRADEAPGAGTTSADDVRDALAGRADDADITARIETLRDRALIWGPDDAIRTAAHAPAALPGRGLHLTGPLAELDTDALRARIDGLGERERELLDTLAQGSPLGRTRDAAPGADPSRPVPRLLALDLITRVDDQTVELAPVVGALVRGERTRGPHDLREPVLEAAGGPAATSGRRSGIKDVDAAAGGEALELLRHLADTLDVLGTTPAAVLRSGGLGVRELRRVAKATGLDTTLLAFVVEVAVAARLVDNGFPDPPVGVGEAVWAPTVAVDTWSHQPAEKRWQTALEAWWTMPRRAWLIGEPGSEGSPTPALAGDLHDVAAPLERRMIVAAMASADPGTSVDIDSLMELLAWRHPRWQRRLHRRSVEATLDEARMVGVVSRGALSSVGRALLDITVDRDPRPTAPESDVDKTLRLAMVAALPEPIDFFLTQADLTITVPGPLTPELATELSALADLESGGAASVYRVTEDSVRRALDTGRTGTEITGFVAAHSRTPVPQSLEYLVADVARRHGQLRVGVASSFVRCEDATTLAAVLAAPVSESLALRALAPTVAVSQAPLRQVLDELREAGFAPAGEDSRGALVDMRDHGIRLPGGRGPRRAPTRRPGQIGPDRLAAVVERMRSHDAAESATPARGKAAVSAGSGESATALLALAVRTGRRVRIGYVDAHGSASRHVVVPSSVGAGQLVTGPTDGDDPGERYSLHRITSVELLEN
ncbi:helicase-associated domain-containing protein [Williamsia serinedens]|uniref:Helicase conserved C-terminal domain-containing protein n=1 Tax=Williamsia serinedens TaxID=391736 RepID=A0ABT1H1S6_9NOCA|nr:helicase-associated domain-containing protein [Williamsia serinedens]MCP2160929.1 Helicase conserved C-terminal domain-containing protein [Williamsia serinedens]